MWWKLGCDVRLSIDGVHMERNVRLTTEAKQLALHQTVKLVEVCWTRSKLLKHLTRLSSFMHGHWMWLSEGT